MDYFHFSGRVPRLLIDGLAVSSATDLILFLAGLIVIAFVFESLQRISRECLRKVPKPSGRTSTGSDGTLLKRTRSDRVPLTRDTENESNAPAEDNSPRPERKNGHIPAENGGTPTGPSCCPSKCDCVTETGEEKETVFLVDETSCCQTELTEEQKRARVESMWKSLSLEVLDDRWEIFQTTCEEREGRPKRITRSDRVIFHLLQTLLGMGQLTIGYVFMLVVMTYNAWFLICIVGGAGLGYLVFSSDLERSYANYAECYIKRKAAEEDARRRSCTPKDSCRKPSWKRTGWTLKRETSC